MVQPNLTRFTFNLSTAPREKPHTFLDTEHLFVLYFEQMSDNSIAMALIYRVAFGENYKGDQIWQTGTNYPPDSKIS